MLIVHPHMSLYGGAELVIVKLANYLTEKGIGSAILTLDMIPEIRKEIVGSDIILPEKPLKFSPKVPYSMTLPPVVLKLIKLVRRNLERFDVINVHNFPAEFTAFSCSKKVVWMCNEPPQVYFTSPSLPVRFLNEVVTAMDKVVVKKYINRVCVADEFNASRFERTYGIRPAIIPYGIGYEIFSKGNGEKARKMFNLNKNDFVILQVGMRTPQKNQLESIKVAKNLRGKIPNVKLILAGHGEGGYEQMLRKYVHDFGLGDQIIFTGHLPRTIIRDLYAACDACLFPVKPQGGWLSPFEALCAGKPIVVSTLMTASSIINGNKIGEVTDDFVGVVLDIYNNPREYYRRAEHGKKWVKENLSWDRFCQKMLKIFQEA